MLGQLVSAYRITRALGEGGMGTVYEGVHESLGRRAAIKVLRPEYSKNKEILQRFFNEARAVNIVQHPSLVNIYEFGSMATGEAYIVMEFLAGESLRARLTRLGGKIGLAAVPIARQIANALSATHQKQIVHRDLKPDNVMLVPDQELPEGERAKVLDFGIAKLSGDGSAEALKVKTKTGAMLGTPTYMSPEQCRGTGSVDGRTDVYSLGVILFEMLAGQPPFVSDGLGELIGMHMFQPVPSLAPLAPKTPKELLQLVERMLAKNPNERPSMEETAAVLTRIGRSVSQSALAMPTRAPYPVEAGPVLSPVNTTVGNSNGQSIVTAQRTQRRRLGLLGAAGALSVAAVIGVIGSKRHVTENPPSPAAPRIEAVVPIEPAKPALPQSPEPSRNEVPVPATNRPEDNHNSDAERPVSKPRTAPGERNVAAPNPAERCQSAFKRGRYADAVELCTAALNKDADQPDVQRTLRAARAAVATPRTRPQATNPSHNYEKVKPLD